jgi:hypothetical protein
MDRYGVIQNNDAYKKQKEEALNSLGSSKGKVPCTPKLGPKFKV